jgi:protein TonB
MKRSLSPFVLLVWSVAVHAQPYQQEQLSFLDSKGKQTKEKNAVVLQQIVRLGDTVWKTNTYSARGPLLRSVQRRTSDENAPFHGDYITYGPDGWADTVGYFDKGVKEGSWLVFSRTRTVTEIHYEEGRVIWQKDSMQLRRERDSVRAVRKGEGKPTDSVESEFPGGPGGWLRYLNHTLRYPDEAINNELMGMVVIEFTVDKDGTVPPASLWTRRSADYWLDKEALRVIAKSGEWSPAELFGEKVRSYKLQPIVFKLEVETPKKGRSK